MFGIINLRKPAGPTSRDCVNHIQRLIRPIKVGHAGTLDPIASGVLLILVGQAARLTDYVHELEKEYLGTFQLGASSPSADRETEVKLLPSCSIPAFDELQTALASFRGQITQTPPIYSAVRIEGKRAYDLARSGEKPDLPARQVTISEIEIVSYSYPQLVLRIVCSTGTYIRSIGRDLARSLQSDAIMTDLVRTRIGPFSITDSYTLESIDSEAAVARAVQSPLVALGHLPIISPGEQELQRLKDGQRVRLAKPVAFAEQTHVAINANGQLHSIVKFDPSDGTWRVEKYFPG